MGENDKEEDQVDGGKEEGKVDEGEEEETMVAESEGEESMVAEGEEKEGMVAEGVEEEGEVGECDEEEGSADEEIVSKPKKKCKAVIEEEESDEESEEGSQQSEDDKQLASNEETPAVRGVAKSASVSHHVDRRCVVGRGCSYVGPNLKRHLKNVHVKKGHIFLNQVDKFFSMGLEGHKKGVLLGRQSLARK